MAVTRVDPSDRRSLKRFVALDRVLWGHEPLHWSEPDADLVKRLRGRSAFNRDIDHALFVLADDAGQDIGRVVGYVNRRWQRQRGEDAGFVGNLSFASGTSTEDAAELFGAVEDWFRERRATHSICGIEGSGVLGYGVLVADHDVSPMFPIKWHPPSYPVLIEGAGYGVERRFWVYRVGFDNEQYRATSERVLGEARCRVRPVDRRHWKAEMALLTRLFNETFADEWVLNDLTEEELLASSGQMKSLVDPRTWLIAEVEGEPAGFCFGMADLAPLFRSFRGRMGPLQIVRLLLGVKNVDRHGLVIVGVRDRFRGRHIGQTMACTLYRHYEQQGITSALYYSVDDTNLSSRRLAESLGAEGRIQLHCYRKPL
ncbi:MAG: GNAT family N-acetyltransferase [Actinomycetota bacterium]|nr:GNAT family N-acetyltransferase [Actinomycetota bacterium]